MPSGTNARSSSGVEPTDERAREADGGRTQTEPRHTDRRRSIVVEGPARPVAVPGAVRLDRGGRAPARARRVGHPLFISSSASELVAARIHDPSYTRWAVGMMYRNGAAAARAGPGRRHRAEGRRDLRGLVAPSPYLGDPLESALGPVTPISVAGEHERRDTRLFMGEQAPDHVEILEVRPATGSWSRTSSRTPSTSPLASGSWSARPTRDRDASGRRDLPVAVQGRSLGYWRPWNDALVLYCGNCAPPPRR